MSINYFFYKNNDGDILDYKFQNNEITVKIAVDQIVDKFNHLNGSDIFIKCPICKIFVQKSESCNGLSHCHVEVCYSCGEFSDIGRPLEDHWSAIGRKGCPRFDNDSFWKTHIEDYICIEGICYSHELGECTESSHATGLEKYNKFRKKQHMYHCLKSLPPDIRDSVIKNLPKKLGKYRPAQKVFTHLDNNLENLDIRRNYLHNTKKISQ
jgi:hypothetical protein